MAGEMAAKVFEAELLAVLVEIVKLDAGNGFQPFNGNRLAGVAILESLEGQGIECGLRSPSEAIPKRSLARAADGGHAEIVASAAFLPIGKRLVRSI
jgi:hypothetical protein